MIRWIHAVVGASVVPLMLHLAVSAQTAAPYPVLFLANYCSDSSAWSPMLGNLPRQRFGEALVRLYQGADGAVHSRGERPPAGAPSYALDFHEPLAGSFDARIVAAIPIVRKVEQVRAAIDYILGSTGQSRVVVVGHGMGGLVARAYVQGRGLTSKATTIPYRSDVAALITIDTPHAGVAIGNPPPADWDRDCAAADTINRREMLPRESAFLQELNRQPWPPATRLDAVATYYTGPNGDTDGVVPRVSQDVASLSEYWARHPDVRVWFQPELERSRQGRDTTVLHSGVLESPVTAALVSGIVDDVDGAQGAGVARPLDHMEPHIESPHPYANNYENEWAWTAPGSPTALDVTFDPLTSVEENYDFIFVTDGAGTNVPGSPFTGTSLAGRTVRVPGPTVRIRLTTDFSVTAYGFRIAGLAAVSSGLPESPHPYTDNLDRTWSYTLAGNPAAIDVTFDPQTAVELDYDYIRVMDAAGTNIEGSPFTGAALAGRTVRVRGSTVQVRLTTDASVTAYGFRITNVAAAADTPTTTIIQPDGEGTTLCRGRIGPEPMQLGVPVVELDHDTSNIDVRGRVNLTARPIGPQADVRLRWYLLGRYGRVIATGCTARYEGPDSIGSAYMTSVDIAVQKDGYRRAPAFAGGTVHVNIYDQRNRLPECNAVVTVTVRGAQYGGITRIDLQGVGTWFPGGAFTFTLPVRVRRGLYTITLATTGRAPAPRNVNVGCPRTDVIFN